MANRVYIKAGEGSSDLISHQIGLWLAIISAVALLAAIGSWDYWYYMALRVLVFSSGFYLAWLLRTEQAWLPVLLVIAALVFNPFFPAHLLLIVWRIVDFACIFVFIAAVGATQRRLKAITHPHPAAPSAPPDQ